MSAGDDIMRTLANLIFVVLVLLALGVAAEELAHRGTAHAESDMDPHGIAAQHLEICPTCRAKHMTVARLMQESTRLPCCREHFHERDGHSE
jgi:predicted anti-sigma-YlaC factor YlaD